MKTEEQRRNNETSEEETLAYLEYSLNTSKFGIN